MHGSVRFTSPVLDVVDSKLREMVAGCWWEGRGCDGTEVNLKAGKGSIFYTKFEKISSEHVYENATGNRMSVRQHFYIADTREKQ